MDEKSVRTMNYYDGICDGYEELYHEEQKQKIFQIISYLDNISGNVLDLGSGDGVFNEYIENFEKLNNFQNMSSKSTNFKSSLCSSHKISTFSKSFINNKDLNNEVFLISCDISFNFLLKNNNKNKVQCNIQNLPLKNDCIDYVFSFTVIQDVFNPEHVICEVKRVLKKGGFFILTFLKMSSKRDLIMDSVRENFQIVRELEGEKDFILVCKNSY